MDVTAKLHLAKAQPGKRQLSTGKSIMMILEGILGELVEC